MKYWNFLLKIGWRKRIMASVQCASSLSYPNHSFFYLFCLFACLFVSQQNTLILFWQNLKWFWVSTSTWPGFYRVGQSQSSLCLWTRQWLIPWLRWKTAESRGSSNLVSKFLSAKHRPWRCYFQKALEIKNNFTSVLSYLQVKYLDNSK